MTVTAMQRRRRSPDGFSLIELMAVLLIVGVLLTVAWPNYQDHVRRGHRAEAQAALLEAQLFMERHYAVHGRYTAAEGQPPALPARLQTVPERGNARYRLSVEAPDAGSYRLVAAPEGAMADDACGRLTLVSTGERGQGGEGATLAQCWR